MTDQTLFPSISHPKTREDIWKRLESVDTPILSLRTFFQDIIYLDVTCKAMRKLLFPSLERKSTNQVTIDRTLGGQCPAGASLSLQEVSQRTQQGLLELWRFSFQYGLEITGTGRRLLDKPEQLNDPSLVRNEPIWISPPAVLRHFFWLAQQEGFTVPSLPNPEPQPMSLPTPQSRESLQNTDCDETVTRRRGIPYIDMVDADRFALEKDRLWEP
ncbi:hypothetical protein FE257_005566 [Aspergillus nanangensis]|uniref:Uncharacterized protein n=1 Tax=Aspergillus nanangensis TaxID=2582783 RepID=A0AAD4CQ78_ASPNN|nr:hypothetical protein FE257_005566 [Aspergillus nanangensis]